MSASPEAAIDAARGVQPAAKEERDVCSKCGSTNTWRTARGSVRCDQCNGWSQPAAQQESALAAEQETSAAPETLTPRGQDTQQTGVDWEKRHQELSTVHAVFTTAIRKAIGMECPCPLSDILDNVIALAEEHRRAWRETRKRSPDAASSTSISVEAKPESSAPSPAQDKPSPRKRKHLVQSAAYWFEGSRKAQEEGKHAVAVAFMENAYNHVENALAAASSPSEQKSSLPAETQTPQERESQETGNT